MVPQWWATPGERLINNFSCEFKAAVLTGSLIKLCHLDELPDGAAKGFDPRARGQDTLFVVRQGPAIRAFKNDCPHWPGSPMAWRKDAYLTADGTHIACSGHGARFDIDTGLCLSGPCVGESLQALALQIDDSGDVYISFEKSEQKTRNNPGAE